MKKYIIDANLPYYFDLWNSEEFIHVFDINDEMTDEEIWKDIDKVSKTHFLTNVYPDRIEGIG
jgi:hypothetical protein